jgi:hypothetical protein
MAPPRGRHGPIGSIRALRIARAGAVKARMSAINSLKSIAGNRASFAARWYRAGGSLAGVFFIVLRAIPNRGAMVWIAMPSAPANGSLPSPPRLAPPDLQKMVKIHPELPGVSFSPRADTL